MIKHLTNNLNHMLTSVDKLLLIHATVHAKLHISLLTMSNFAQQIIANMKFSFEFLYSFGPTHARKIEIEMISTAFSNIYITGFK